MSDARPLMETEAVTQADAQDHADWVSEDDCPYCEGSEEVEARFADGSNDFIACPHPCHRTPAQPISAPGVEALERIAKYGHGWQADAAHEALVAIKTAALSVPTAPAQSDDRARPIDTAPKDGTMVRLLVNYSDGDHALEDEHPLAWTVGFNGFEDHGVDEWKFAGWCWTHDHFVQGSGKPVGWLPWSNPATGGEDQ